MSWWLSVTWRVEVESSIVGNNRYPWYQWDPLLPALAVCYTTDRWQCNKIHGHYEPVLILVSRERDFCCCLCEAGKVGSTAHAAHLVFLHFKNAAMLLIGLFP